MKAINKVLIGALAVLSLASCAADFMETKPTSAASTATVFESTDNVKMAVNGLAYYMCKQHYPSFSQGYCGENRIISIYSEYTSQEFRYNQMAPGWADIMNFTEYCKRTDTVYPQYPWTYYYAIICDANAIIENVDDAEGSEDEKAFYKAQALTFRAYCYTKLLELYTPRWQDTNNGSVNAVVLRLDSSTGSMPLSTVADVYTQIYKDCEDAVNYFEQSGMDRPSGEVWLTNLNVAHGVWAHAALNKQDYQTALTHAKAARNGYALMSVSDYKAGFATPTSEWLWGSYSGSDENQWYWAFGVQFACNGYYSASTRNGAGCIEKELTDQIPDNDIRKGLFLTVDKFPGTNWATEMDQTYGYFLSDPLWAAARAYIDANSPADLAAVQAAYKSGYFYLGAQLKFWVFDTPGVSYLPFMRSSEMVLIEAEANYFLKNENAARAALVELNATSGRNPSYTCTLSGDALFKEIRNYRELELFGEGFNWNDMKRWNLDIVRKSFADGGNCHVATAVTVPANSKNGWYWPIPETETDHNKEIQK